METRARFESGDPHCPVGGPIHGYPVTVVRHGLADLADIYPHMGFSRGTVSGVTDVAYRCTTCGHEWGWELLTDEFLAANGQGDIPVTPPRG